MLLVFASRRLLVACAALVLSAQPLSADEPAASDAPAAEKVSFYKQVRPIFQANCQGCHQPAKASGAYVMTTFDRMAKGGESEMPAVVPGKPVESYLLDLITPADGQAEMPKGKSPLAATEIELIKLWIAEGADDDTPAGARERYDQDHPPLYTRPPVITSIDFSPDGELLAVAGFHEVLLWKADGSQLVGRLVGLSERIESVRFSPDGTKLSVTGGLPGRTGEIQVWNVGERQLVLSVPVTYDTIYGGSWSPDGKLIAFGCADNTVRAINAETGEQVLFQGAHSDWVRDTVFSVDGSHVVSVSRDMTAKLTEVETQRFVDNVTSITPGALKGGMLAIDRHPTRDEVVVGGSDGVAKVYRMQRLSVRVIGDDGNLIRRMPPMTGRIFSVAVSKDGTRIAAGSSLDGSGEVQVYSYEFDTSLPDNIKAINEKVVTTRSAEENAALEKYHTDGVRLVSKTGVPGAAVYAVAFHPNGQVLAAAGSDGTVRLINPETGEVAKQFSPAPLDDQPVAAVKPAETPVLSANPATLSTTQAAGASAIPEHPDFIRDVNPILSRVGCNAGTCHGSADGRNGFKLSLRGYDAIFDVRALTDDLASRRVNVASPEDSLMLLKTTAAVPHVGGQVIQPGDRYYEIIRRWIADGAKLDLSVPRVVGIEVTPTNPVVEKIGDTAAIRVTANYADGATRDVTREAFIESGNTEVATVDREGVAKAVRRGEAPILARYEGAYAATTLTSMGDREGFVWEQPPSWGKIDDLAIAKWQRMKTLPAPLTSDPEFIRRVYLDLTGLPPTADEVRAFLADERDTRVKRDALVDKLVGSDPYVEFWTNKWADLLQVNSKFLGGEGAKAFRKWIRDEVAANTPYDQFARKILTASGSNRENPAASYYKILRDPLDTMENTTHLFLGVRFNCNKCHDHPFERWTQDQYYETAAFFAHVGLKRDPESGDRNIGGTAVEGAKPLYEVVFDKPEGDVIHDRTKAVAPPEFPFETEFTAAENASRRDRLAAWTTSADNRYFARSYVNRLWGYLFGVGIIEPIDDIRAGNPPTNPELLDHLTGEFVQSGFDVRHVMRLIAKSRVYQLSIETNPWNADDKINYSHAIARRLPAEVLYDAIYRVTGAVSKIPGVPPGTRAAELPDVDTNLPDGFLTNLGRPPRESACECERSGELQLGPIMALINGPTVGQAIGDPESELTKLVASEPDNQKLINEVFLRIVNRDATDDEVAATLREMHEIESDHQKLLAAVQEREQVVAARRVEQEKRREEAIAKARTELDAYEVELKPILAEREQKRQEQIAQRQSELAEYEATLPAKLAEFEAQQASAAKLWQTLDPTELKASTGAKLTREPDLAVLAEAKDGQVVYTFTAETDLMNVTGIQLEALADDRLPSRGPGLSPNGNFVVTELTLTATSKADASQTKEVKLENALADFSQGGYDVKTAIDGKRPRQNNGWAIAGGIGTSHWATFETAEPLGFEGGTILTFKLDQRYADNKHALGKFRLSITTAGKPVGLGLPAELATLLATPADQRTDDQKAALLKHYGQRDEELKKRQTALAEAQKPLPPDPKLVQLKETLETASRPIPEDPALVRLKSDLEMSTQQLSNQRLTAAQDLAWALINSPEFLFNH
ncbi:MAG TPA: DUF1549 domain-containing protein [Planctomycetaceae bacterium]|nr:DUF1549 domain-containing protein [Planctomycetaceae bacterium]